MVSKFSDLDRLILVHGHYFYCRMSKLLLFTVYKETMVCMVLFLYQNSNNYSGSTPIDYDLLMVYEFVVSFFSIITVALFDKDVYQSHAIPDSAKFSSRFNEKHLNWYKIAFNHIIGSIHGLVIYIFVTIGFKGVNSFGFTENFDTQGIIYFILITLSLVFYVVQSTKKNFLSLFSLIFTVLIAVLAVIGTYSNILTSYSISQNTVISHPIF